MKNVLGYSVCYDKNALDSLIISNRNVLLAAQKASKIQTPADMVSEMVVSRSLTWQKGKKTLTSSTRPL
jgi:hypothetical protein